MGFNWGAFALKLPMLIGGLMDLSERFKGRGNGKDKHDAVVASLPEMIELLEFGAGRDVLNDAAIMALRDEYIAAQALVINAKREADRIVVEAQAIAERARAALQQGILAKQPQ